MPEKRSMSSRAKATVGKHVGWVKDDPGEGGVDAQALDAAERRYPKFSPPPKRRTRRPPTAAGGRRHARVLSLMESPPPRPPPPGRAAALSPGSDGRGKAVAVAESALVKNARGRTGPRRRTTSLSDTTKT